MSHSKKLLSGKETSRQGIKRSKLKGKDSGENSKFMKLLVNKQLLMPSFKRPRRSKKKIKESGLIDRGKTWKLKSKGRMIKSRSRSLKRERKKKK